MPVNIAEVHASVSRSIASEFQSRQRGRKALERRRRGRKDIVGEGYSRQRQRKQALEPIEESERVESDGSVGKQIVR